MKRNMIRFSCLSPEQERRLNLIIAEDKSLHKEVLNPVFGVTDMTIIIDGYSEVLKFLLYHELVRQGRILEAPR